MLGPLNLELWAQEHAAELRPPVCNKLVFRENGFIIMAVGGPNFRSDFHCNEGPEFFYQMRGDMVLRLKQDDGIHDVVIREGEIYLLEPKIPHSPQRPKDSLGLVVERSRLSSEMDALKWYCSACTTLIYEETFALRNIEKDLPQVFARYENTPRTCPACHHPAPSRRGDDA